MNWTAVFQPALIFSRFAALGAASCLTLTLAEPAKADVTYDYTGNLFTDSTYIQPTLNGFVVPAYGTKVTGSVTFDSVVTPTYTGGAYFSDIVSWSFSSGTFSISAGDAGAYLESLPFVFEGGNVTVWYVGAFSTFTDNILLTANDGQYGIVDYASLGGLTTGAFQDYNLVVNNPGTWKEVTAVPEPSTWAMMLLGFVGLGWTAQRRSIGQRAAA